MTQEQERKILKIIWYLLISLVLGIFPYLLIRHFEIFDWSEMGPFTKVQLVILILQIFLIIPLIKTYDRKMHDQLSIDKLRANVVISFLVAVWVFLYILLFDF
ncbi:hypothetical protein KKH39_03910 [Patescibacteria group bacterium]|nr:hypothetical protein [Patescibacteria group bacterium]